MTNDLRIALAADAILAMWVDQRSGVLTPALAAFHVERIGRALDECGDPSAALTEAMRHIRQATPRSDLT